MEIKKESLRVFREEFMNTVAPLEEKFGVTISMGNIGYGKSDFSARLTVSNGNKAEVEQRDFERYSALFGHLGIDKGMYRQEFGGCDGKKYILIGLNPKAKKNICEIKDKATGKVCRSAPGFLGIPEKV